MFIEAYRPRLIQTLTAKTPLGGLFAKFPRLFLPDRVLRQAINELFGPNTKPSDELWQQFSEIVDHNDGRRVTHKVGRLSSTVTTTATGGCGRCARRACRCASSTAHATLTRDVTWPSATAS